MDMLHLRSADDYHSLKPDSWGIPSLDATTVQARGNCFGGHGLGGDGSETRPLDLILMPGAAFDQTFRRLGHGKGYYDRFLQKYQDAVRNVPNGRMPLLGAYFTFHFPSSCPHAPDALGAARSLCTCCSRAGYRRAAPQRGWMRPDHGARLAGGCHCNSVREHFDPHGGTMQLRAEQRLVLCAQQLPSHSILSLCATWHRVIPILLVFNLGWGSGRTSQRRCRP